MKTKTQPGGLRIVSGDLWERWKHGHPVVIPTNIGWTYTHPMKNVMGKGLAKQATSKIRDLAEWYGVICCHCREATPVIDYDCGLTKGPLLLFPTKPLNPDQPYLSWSGPATIEQIAISTTSLRLLVTIKQHILKFPVCLPLVGCGNGGLDKEVVLDALNRLIPDSEKQNYLIVDSHGDVS